MRTVTPNKCFIVEDTHVKAIVAMEDAPMHTAENGYRCDDPTCLCNAPVDDDTMPDDIRKYYEPIEECSYDHPGIPAPCWEHVEEDEMDCFVEYPLARRTFEYTIPESGNGRSYHTTSSQVDWE